MEFAIRTVPNSWGVFSMAPVSMLSRHRTPALDYQNNLLLLCFPLFKVIVLSCAGGGSHFDGIRVNTKTLESREVLVTLCSLLDEHKIFIPLHSLLGSELNCVCTVLKSWCCVWLSDVCHLKCGWELPLVLSSLN